MSSADDLIKRGRAKFLEEWFGDQVDQCPHCKHPKLKDFVCQNCGKDPSDLTETDQ